MPHATHSPALTICICNVQRATCNARRDARQVQKLTHTQHYYYRLPPRVCVAGVRVCAAPIMAAILLLPLAAFTLNEIPF